MATLLLELFSEEIPSRMQRSGAEQLERLVAEGFKKQGLAPTQLRTFVSPRHLALQAFGLPTVQPDVTEEKRGPKIGAPEQALKGFLQSTGLTLEQCEQRDGYYFATTHRKGRAVAEVVKEIVEAALAAFVWPKSMRWGAHGVAWVRPLHALTCLLDATVVPVTFAHLTAGNITYGHRFLAPQPITLTHAEHYLEALAAAQVMVDYTGRKEAIRAGVAAVAAQQNLTLVDDESLLDEVTGLVEWPVPLAGHFEEKFLELPPEVLISEMKTHQRYFALRRADGALANRFITVANMVNADGGKKVMEGNSRVVRARLSDGEFYWTQDRLVKLEDWGKKLSDVVFHAKVGMMDAKVARIETLALTIANAVGFTDTAAVQRAAHLCKADLTSGMVGEFPELQGIMGRYYATLQGEPAAVAEAIYEHYKPQGASDGLPESTLGAIIALADKLDSIISLFAAGEKPTGSKDPLALRRAALGVLRIVLARGWNLDLTALTSSAEVVDFFHDRMKNLLRDEGLRHDVIEAASLTASGAYVPTAIAEQARALNRWIVQSPAVPAIKRSLNILAAEEKKAKTRFAATTAGAQEPSEKALAAALAQVQKNTASGPACLDALAEPINQFFTDLLVTEEGKKDARLGLLAAVRDTANTLADFSKLEG